jgi:hypothetical protein
MRGEKYTLHNGSIFGDVYGFNKKNKQILNSKLDDNH